MRATIKFRPTSTATLTVLKAANVISSKDPAETYGTLISAAMVSAAMLDLSEEQVMQQIPVMIELAKKAVAKRADIFGEQS